MKGVAAHDSSSVLLPISIITALLGSASFIVSCTNLSITPCVQERHWIGKCKDEGMIRFIVPQGGTLYANLKNITEPISRKLLE